MQPSFDACVNVLIVNLLFHIFFAQPLCKTQHDTFDFVTIGDEGLQMSYPHSALMAPEKEGYLSFHICCDTCDTWSRFWRFGLKDHAIYLPCTTSKE